MFDEDLPREYHDRELDDWRERVRYRRDGQDHRMGLRRAKVLEDINVERNRQIVKWGPQVHPDGTNKAGDSDAADRYRDLCDARAARGAGTWRDILLEETFEAIAESDPVKLRKELIQSAAVITAWVEDIDGRAV